MARKPPWTLGAIFLVLAGTLFFLLFRLSSPSPPALEELSPGRKESPAEAREGRPGPQEKPPRTGERRRLGEERSESMRPPSWIPFLGRIKGRLVDPKGEPAPGYQVEIIGDWPSQITNFLAEFLGREKKEEGPPPLAPLARTRTGGNGKFLLEGVFPGETALLRVEGPGGASLLLEPIPRVPGPGEEVDLGDLRLPDSGSLEGKVVDEDTGEPIEGALVWATNLPGIASASGFLDIRGGEWAAAQLQPSTPPLLFRIPRAVGRLKSVLGFPSCRTGKDGKFFLRHIPPGRCSLTVLKEGYLPFRRISFPVRPGRTRDMGELELRKGVEIQVLVKDSSGTPLEGIRILGGAMPPLLPMAIMAPLGRTDGAGELRARGLPEGRIYLAASREGGPWTVKGPFSPGERAELTLDEGEQVLLACVTEEGGVERPVKPATAVLTSPLDPSPIRCKVQIGSDGRVLFSGLSKGGYMFRATAEGFAPVTLFVQAGPPGGKEKKVVFRKGSNLLVFVRDGKGNPVEDARVLPFFSIEGGPNQFLVPEFSAYRAFTDAGGKAVLKNLPPGKVSILVQHPRAGNVSVKTTLPAEAPLVVILDPGRIEGWVVPPPAPAEEGPLQVILAGNDGSPSPIKTALLSPEGTFTFPSVAPGRWTITVLKKRLSFLDGGNLLRSFGSSGNRFILVSENVEVARGETRKVILRVGGKKGSSGTVRGVVTSRGRPAPGLFVRAYDEGGGRDSGASARTDERGAFVLPGVPSGKVTLEVRCQDAGFEGSLRTLETRTFHLPPGGDYRISVDLRTGTIRGKVLAGGGRPSGSLMVEARRTEKGSSGGDRIQAITQPDGTFTMENVPLGTWRVGIRSRGLVSSRRPEITLSLPGDSARVILHALKTVAVRVVLDPPLGEDEYLQGYRLVPRGGPMKAPLAERAFVFMEGFFKIEAPPGTYTLEAWGRKTGGKTWIARGEITVPRRPGKTLRLALGPREDPAEGVAKYPVSGKLLGKDGKPAGPASVHCTLIRSPGLNLPEMAELEFRISVSKDGTFSTNLPAGTYTWWALVKKGKRIKYYIPEKNVLSVPPGGATGLVLR